ncbi:tyrosine--tRNA ligase [Nocardioides nematodiphilus]|uniref:tyrosine--tRNA ligase n=1 Tax=Nocardioides nematodiphilus TaxID=2849669 RepID=UPI001CDA0853|nr:tyrosine--tRNA ligase [Nocardioides nematodiphilus]MCA1983850.1 tyrosine--tRNA ligase [Nocardioides nematodiphilus]
MTIDPTLLDDLEWRGLIADSTDRDALRDALAGGSVRFYIGFDPSAPSLHMGNLLQIVTAMRLQRAGHTPFALVGGATGMIGDPKDSGERTLNSLDTVKEWVENLRRQLAPFFDFEGDEGFTGTNGATLVNNYDWTASLSTIDFLREVGKHFPVNRMLARDTVRNRLESGISYTEFSYVLLQSMDFLNLYRDFGVTLQHGGSDQWGNITGGVELIRRAEGGHAHAFTTPLVTKADGTKYGKTEGGALWLDPEMMSPYAFHQFWLNVEDVKVGEMLRFFTFLTREEIEALDAEMAEKPFLRAGQKALADHMTTLVHGARETEQAKAAAAALFGGGDLTVLDPSTLAAALREAGTVTVDRADGLGVVSLLVAAGLATSNGDARRTISEGGAYVNNERVEDPDAIVPEADLIGGSWLVLRRGKKRFAGVEVR